MRSTRNRIAATAIALLAACSDKAAGPFADIDMLTVEQSACLFDCPAFTVSIRADGQVRHVGPFFDASGGPVESRIGPDGLARIAQAVRDARIDAMRDRYEDEADGCETRMSDMSTVSVTVSRGRGARDKRVALYAGCLGAGVPAGRIDGLIKGIDRETGTGKLLEQRKPGPKPV